MIAIFSRCRRSSGFQNWSGAPKRCPGAWRCERCNWTQVIQMMQIRVQYVFFSQNPGVVKCPDCESSCGLHCSRLPGLASLLERVQMSLQKNDEIMRSKCVMQRAFEESVVNVADKPSEALKEVWAKRLGPEFLAAGVISRLKSYMIYTRQAVPHDRSAVGRIRRTSCCC